jgi:hypothetical protein
VPAPTDFVDVRSALRHDFEVALLPQSEALYLRSPRLEALPDGRARLYAIGWEGGSGERLLCFHVDAEGEPASEPDRGPLTEGIVALTPATPPEPTADAGAELRAESERARAEVRHIDGASEVWVEREGARHLVFRARCTAAAPALADAQDGGTWVAFHHDLREDELRPDVAKWLALRYLAPGGEVMEPSSPMRERDRDRREVEQSFEFPALAVGRDGAVALFGRGSHNFWRQDLDASGFSARLGISDGEWGSRGRRVSAVTLTDGALLVARRDRKGVVVDRQAGPSGGAPALAEAVVDLMAGAAPVARRDRTIDPAAAHGMRTFFGDIQQHSAHSDGIGSADEPYLRARHRYGDDFVALTDHESFLGKRTGPGEWLYLQEVADRHDDPGRFATLVAYEWTGRMYPGPGHKCVYFPRRGMPLVSRDEVPTGKDLVARIKALGGIASPHHIGWTGCDEEGHDPEGQPVWEICSCHGCYEHADHPLGQRGEHRHQLVDVMLQKGHRFGFTAASDSHGLLWHHGECRKRDPFRTGLTAVQATELSREAVFEAIRARRCYATSGAKILLDLVVDGHPMGSEIHASGPVKVSAHAIGEGALARLELVGPEGVLRAADAKGDELRLEAELAAPYLYARAVQRDGEMAWSSPVFIDGSAG